MHVDPKLLLELVFLPPLPHVRQEVGGGRLCLMQLWASWPTTVSVIGLGWEGGGWMDGWMGECAAHFSSRKL